VSLRLDHRDGLRYGIAGCLGVVLGLLLLAGIHRLTDVQADPDAVAQALAKKARGSRAPLRKVRARLAQRRPRTKSKSDVRLAQRPKVKEEEKKKPKPVEDLNGQVVETAKPAQEERPDKTRYLGRYDMKVEREQKSTGRKKKGRDLGRVQVDKPSELQSAASKSKKPTTLPRAERLAKKKQKADEQRPDKPEQKAAALYNVPVPAPGEGKAPDRAGAGAIAGGRPTEETGRPQPSVMRNAAAGLLLPATSPGNIMHNIQALAGSPGSDDYLPDVDEEGDVSLLNTRKFRYWEFFQRIKERVRDEWSPAEVWRQRDPNGKRYGVRDRLTVVRVTLDQGGDVKKVDVHRKSGLGFLDDEARRAFLAAAPFPNPPDGLRNEAGDIEFKFGFMFEISSSRFHFYRVPR
jgi:TonB family protein